MDQLLNQTTGAKVGALQCQWTERIRDMALADFTVSVLIGFILVGLWLGILDFRFGGRGLRDADVRVDFWDGVLFVNVPSIVLMAAAKPGLHPLKAANLAGAWCAVTIAFLAIAAYKMCNDVRGSTMVMFLWLVDRGAFVVIVSRFIIECEDAVIANVGNQEICPV